ncbi:ATP-dependent RNA helicase TDRD9 [Solea senegalensis]|uniref:ATP-dependent RNA helicase TDRD9 n=1 Tax=Solea senegalensis TaxID=28829 RepID=A0AAV6S3K5_SOLSE|nr:ATP-dependent RNA helicase TDRD9 [Solea senegalensis]KAG7511385.1 ATP-dependent RNA helicase TDRD9 [Solea senegalensis]
MKKTFTADQIANWFTSGTTFTKINITEKAAEKNVDESVKESRPSDIPVENCLKKLNLNGGRFQKPEPAGSTAAPPLTSYEYPSLPITKHRQQLISFIENNSVVIIRGATGSGKTTQLPQFILDHYNEKNAPCNIVVTQPRKIGATSIARWVAAQRKCTLGSLVGYQVGLEKMATEHTRLIYMTTGVLLQKLVSAKCLTEYSHIFIDEVHERTKEMDFLLLVLRKLLHFNSRFVKIILMSATCNCKQFADYFATPLRGTMNPAYVFEVEGAPYAIEEFYLDDLNHLFPYRASSLNPDDPSISFEMYNLAISLIQRFDELEGKESRDTDQQSGMTSPEKGSVLVFLPGINEISYMHEALAKLGHKRLQVYPLHSSVTLEEQNGVFLPPVPGYRKIIISTNIAESSVTVPDVKYVIDFCLARHLVCDPDTNHQSLHLTWASKTNCNQRRGRAGRVSKGYCYRLITKDFWKQNIPDYMIPDMLLAPLAAIVLKVKLLDMGDPRSLLSCALSPPDLDDIVRTVLQLKEMGALSVKSGDTTGNEDGELTFLGRVLAHLPVDLHLGKMIVLGHVFGCLEESLIIAASCSLKSFFAIPFMQQLAGHRSKLAFARGTKSDSIAFVNAFKAWQSSKATGKLRHPKDELDWGKENFIQIKRIKEVADLYEDLKKRVSQFNMHVPDGSQRSDYTSANRQKFILQVVIAGAYYPNYFAWGEIDEEMSCKEFYGLNPRTTVMLRSLPPYSFLYYKQLQSLFRLCGQVKTIVFDSSRAYVEFYATSQDSGVLPEVSLALLLAQQKPRLELSVHPIELIEKCPGTRGSTNLKYAGVKADFQNQTVCPGVGFSTTDADKLPPNPLFVVSITEVVEVGHFWGFQADEASSEKQRHLTAEINRRTLDPLTVSLYPNLRCLAPYSENNDRSLYYRAKILHIRGSTVEVFFLDYGNTEVVACSSLRELPSDLLSPPFLAREFKVCGMRPSPQSIILGNRWSSRARDFFQTLVKGTSHLVSLYSILHNVMHVKLLISTNTANTSVVDILVKEGHAVEAEECYASKQSHEELMSLYKDKEAGTYVPHIVTDFCKNRNKEAQNLIDDLLTHFSKSGQPVSRTKVPLSGPNSPHEIKFHSLSQHPTTYKPVLIDKYSINSQALNENPHYKHQRMLVAGTVSVSSTGSHIILRDTSLMPDIPGLPALLTMLFTPIMELRMNEERTCYTGALCGLGWDSQTCEAILPEHDIELTFDVKLDVEDVTEVNALRVAVNRLVCDGPCGTLHLGPDRISQLQDDCREHLIRLFTKSPARQTVAPDYYEKSGKWDQVDPSVKMNMEEPGRKKMSSVLYHLHPVTLLSA